MSGPRCVNKTCTFGVVSFGGYWWCDTTYAVPDSNRPPLMSPGWHFLVAFAAAFGESRRLWSRMGLRDTPCVPRTLSAAFGGQLLGEACRYRCRIGFSTLRCFPMSVNLFSLSALGSSFVCQCRTVNPQHGGCNAVMPGTNDAVFGWYICFMGACIPLSALPAPVLAFVHSPFSLGACGLLEVSGATGHGLRPASGPLLLPHLCY